MRLAAGSSSRGKQRADNSFRRRRREQEAFEHRHGQRRDVGQASPLRGPRPAGREIGAYGGRREATSTHNSRRISVSAASLSACGSAYCGPRISSSIRPSRVASLIAPPSRRSRGLSTLPWPVFGRLPTSATHSGTLWLGRRARQCPHRLGGQRSGGDGNDERVDRLAVDFVRHADHRRFDHLRQFGDHLFDFLRADAIAHRLDEVAAAVDEEEESVAIDAGHVAGEEFSLAKEAGGLLRIVPISRRDILAAGGDLADFAAAGQDRAPSAARTSSRVCGRPLPIEPSLSSSRSGGR